VAIFHTIEVMLSTEVEMVGGQELVEFPETREFHDCCSGTGCTIDRWAVRKIVLCIAWFAYSLLSLLFVL